MTCKLAACQARAAAKDMLSLEEMGRVGWTGLSEMLRTQPLNTAKLIRQVLEAGRDSRQQQEFLQIKESGLAASKPFALS